MAFVDVVEAWVTSNHFFAGAVQVSGSDVYIPSANRYPHIHIGSGFIVYSKSSSNHSYLVNGNDVFAGRCQTARSNCNEAHIIQVCRYIESQG
jgi:hypothetical protein